VDSRHRARSCNAIVCAVRCQVVVWDKGAGLGSTDPLNGDVASWAGMLMANVVRRRTIEKVAQIFRR